MVAAHEGRRRVSYDVRAVLYFSIVIKSVEILLT